MTVKRLRAAFSSGGTGIASAGTQDKPPVGEDADAPGQQHPTYPIGCSSPEIDTEQQDHALDENDRMNAPAAFSFVQAVTLHVVLRFALDSDA